eukprot:2386816-Rhodomonas_salina.3
MTIPGVRPENKDCLLSRVAAVSIALLSYALATRCAVLTQMSGTALRYAATRLSRTCSACTGLIWTPRVWS